MLAVLDGLADVERDLIRTRTAEVRSRAKAQGQHMGRPPQQQKEATRRRAQGLRSMNWPAATTSAYQPFAA
jgi:DNA invertase Pin-like site-specific DNA recombinase